MIIIALIIIDYYYLLYKILTKNVVMNKRLNKSVQDLTFSINKRSQEVQK